MKKISNMELRRLYKEPDVGALLEDLRRAGHVYINESGPKME